jgi:hypothetical protein
VTTAGYHDLLALFDEIGEEGAAIVANHGPERDGKHEIVAGPPMAQLAFTVHPVSGLPMWFSVVTQKGADAGIGIEDDVSAPSPITSVGATSRLALSLLKRGNSGTAVPTPGMEGYVINKGSHA